jgi:hypothetical protein
MQGTHCLTYVVCSCPVFLEFWKYTCFIFSQSLRPQHKRVALKNRERTDALLCKVAPANNAERNLSVTLQNYRFCTCAHHLKVLQRAEVLYRTLPARLSRVNSVSCLSVCRQPMHALMSRPAPRSLPLGLSPSVSGHSRPAAGKTRTHSISPQLSSLHCTTVCFSPLHSGYWAATLGWFQRPHGSFGPRLHSHASSTQSVQARGARHPHSQEKAPQLCPVHATCCLSPRSIPSFVSLFPLFFFASALAPSFFLGSPFFNVALSISERSRHA